jgi:nicotinate-nucleotide adenylyltransferase
VGPVGILGGTFDPVHNAHLAVARLALERLRLERLLWIPTGHPPYRKPPVASAGHRVAMLKLALAGERRFAIDERELAPGHPGYTVDTLEGLRAELGAQTPLCLLMGGDQYSKFDSWHRPADIARLAAIVVFARPGWSAPDERAQVVPMAPLDISASAIRARLARREDISGMVPGAVAGYIARHGLYR